VNVAATFCATLVDEWARAGVTRAVLSPGSRSTPLALALAAEPRIDLHVVLDERSAAFFALGIGLRTGGPALVLTTSGTAAAELHPAVIEAHYAGVPLLVVTADRPPEAHDVGAPQTIEQGDLYGRAVRWRADPGVPDPDTAHSWRSLAARAVAEALGVGGPPGPVHLNLAFREPLVGRPGPLPPGRDGAIPWHRAMSGALSVPPGIDELARQMSGRTGLIVSGVGSGDPAPVHHLADLLRWPVLVDARSPARIPARATVATYDTLLRHPLFAQHARPDVVVRIGGTPVSRVLAAFLASSRAEEVTVQPHGGWIDPERSAAVVVAADPSALCRALAEARPEPAPENWGALWFGAERAAQEAIDEVVANHREPTEPGVARTLVSCLNPGASLLVASSMPIRDVEWYARPRTDVRIMANRGANGIDGTLSTMLGVAAGSKGRESIGLVGDLAFLHDSGALLGAASRGLDAVIVVVDNRGGGIFSFLDQATSVPAPTFERLFATPHDVDLTALVRVHGLRAHEIREMAELAPVVASSLDAGGVTVIVAHTDRAANVALHDELRAAVAAALDSTVA
jgi:2-succinyl-5-enolpyruvyl-6-hydroxy-3-cyclohexene-1-carboxylate synthase